MAQMRVLARTVDLLGRQQIATVQNAIVELFKNAYDAGASRIQVDYCENFCADGKDLISIRDNGLGMSYEDFLNKWLVIGTDNKVAVESTRGQTGEKGIGRLSIALLGDIVLILSFSHKTQRWIASLIHWGIFQLEKIGIEDIDFPVLEFDKETVPDKDKLASLRVDFSSTLSLYEDKLGGRNRDLISKINNEIAEFLIDPHVVARYLSRYTDESGEDILNTNGGTWFIIGNPSEMMRSALSDEESGGRNKRNTGFSSMLHGFTANAFTGKPLDFITSFRVWKNNSFFPVELLNSEGFISFSELTDGMDYFINGEVDDDGNYVGTIYCEGKTKQLRISPPAYIGKIDCGSFRFCLGTLQLQRELSRVANTSLPLYESIRRKLQAIGGVYIYRDGIRVLPYGSQLGGDWLEIERHRVHLVGRYYISRSNLIGAVMLQKTVNSALQEKAGREGFQKNRAYRQLREIVLNVLMVLSREYFSINKDKLEAYQRQAEEERQKRKALMELRRKNAAELHKFRTKLEDAIEAYEKGTPQTEVEGITEIFERELGIQAKHNSSGGFLLGTLQRLPKKAYEDIDKVRSRYAVDYPMGLAIPSDLQYLWRRYQSIMGKLEEENFIPAKARVAELINRQIEPMEKWQKRDLLCGSIESLAAAGENHAKRQTQKTISLIHSFEERCKNMVLGIVDKVNELNRLAENQAKATLSSGDAVAPLTIIGWQQELFNDTKRALAPSYALEALLRRVLALIGNSDTQAAVDVFGALQQAVSDYEARADEDFEMIQKGVAVAIIEHEFFAAINDIHLELAELESLAKRVTALWPMSQRIKTAFAHLDSFIKVLNPLQKRVYSDEENITGEAIRLYLQRAFGSRYARDHVMLTYSAGFGEYSMRIAPAVLYPVLINLVDNALYWLGTISSERMLVFELTEGGIKISNNGPKIEDEVKELIFTRGFSLKRGGKGLGLYIAKEVLRESGWKLDLCTPSEGCNVAFSIVKKPVRPR